MAPRMRSISVTTIFAVLVLALVSPARAAEEVAAVKRRLDQLGIKRGICMLLGDNAALAVPLAQQTELTIFVQSPDAKLVDGLCKQADAAGLLGTRLYVHHGKYERLHLAE